MGDNQTCFVIMPFGDKEDEFHKITKFDVVYEYIIKEAVESIGLECIRCDEIAAAGSIHQQMIEHIFAADVAIVDVTTLNANVFYEFGVRHALRNSVTVLIRKKGTRMPFNVHGFKVIEYDEKDLASVAKAKSDIKEFVQNGLKDQDRTDSLVHQVLADLRIERGAVEPKREARPLNRRETYEYQLKRVPNKRIGLLTGDIYGASNIDIWVNSENTNMQMARYYDRSLSGAIRYYGARKGVTGHIEEDTIANELIQIMGSYEEVPPATIIPTGAGELEKTHNVKKIFHAASVEGQVGAGYNPINKVEACITNALRKVDQDFKEAGFKTILFPIMGTGSGRGDIKESAGRLIQTAIDYLETHPDSPIECAYFLTWRDLELEACQTILEEAGLEKV